MSLMNINDSIASLSNLFYSISMRFRGDSFVCVAVLHSVAPLSSIPLRLFSILFLMDI